MNTNKIAVFTSLLSLLIASLACSLFESPGVNPTPTEFIFEPVTTPLIIEPASLPAAQANVEYSVELQVSQNVTPVFDMHVSTGRLPAGLEFLFLEKTGAAVIQGLPQESGTFTFTVFVACFGTMVSGQTLSKEYQIIVNAASGEAQPLSVILKSVEAQELGSITEVEREHDRLWEIEVCSVSACQTLYIDSVSGQEIRREKTDHGDERPPEDGLLLSTIVQSLEARGWGNDIEEIEFEHGLWEVELRQDGRKIKLMIDPGNGEILPK